MALDGRGAVADIGAPVTFSVLEGTAKKQEARESLMAYPSARRARSGRHRAASPASRVPFRGLRAVLGLGLLAVAMSAFPQAPPPNAGGARPKSVEQTIQGLAGTAKEFPPEPGDHQNPADLDAKAKALGKTGLDQFFKGTDNAKRAAGIAKIVLSKCAAPGLLRFLA